MSRLIRVKVNLKVFLVVSSIFLRLFYVVFLLVGVFGRLAFSHPHVFVEARSRLIFDDAGLAVAVEHVFRFDDAFTAFAIQGFDVNNDGVYDRSELSELAQVNVESMEEYGFFTFGDNTRVELDFKAPSEGYWLEVVDVPLEKYWALKPEDVAAMREDAQRNNTLMQTSFKLLELHFTLPFKEPSDAAAPITLDVYDPTYYVDFRFSHEAGALGVVNEPGSCSVERKDPPPMDAAAAFALAQIGSEQREIPPELQSAASSQVNQMIIRCAGAGAISDLQNSQMKEPAPSSMQQSSAADPVSEKQLPAETTNGSDFSVSKISQWWFGTISALQSDFYQRLIAALRAFRHDPAAGWLLVGLSFAYGVFHAAGPGHGKAVISSYIVASRETLKKGILLSFMSAFAQAVTAVLLIGVAAFILKLTSIAIQDSARWFEIGSYALVTLLGLKLLWQKLLRPIVTGKEPAGCSHGHHDHHHDHDHDHDHDHGHGHVCSSCGHAHAPTPDMVSGKIDFVRAASIVAAVGLRPCSGALIVLVFALSQGMIGVGILATFAMAVGTGITVSFLACLAVGARDLAATLFGEGSSRTAQIHRIIEVTGAFVVFLLGLSLLVATIGWG